MTPALNTNRNPLDLAGILDISVSKARDLVKKCDEGLPGWGPLRKQHNIIARRHVNQGWNVDLSHWQKLHDQGKVNICQGRDGNYFILYAQWNQTPVSRRAYFFVDRGY